MVHHEMQVAQRKRDSPCRPARPFHDLLPSMQCSVRQSIMITTVLGTPIFITPSPRCSTESVSLELPFHIHTPPCSFLWISCRAKHHPSILSIPPPLQNPSWRSEANFKNAQKAYFTDKNSLFSFFFVCQMLIINLGK